jgi:hypothetical protein
VAGSCENGNGSSIKGRKYLNYSSNYQFNKDCCMESVVLYVCEAWSVAPREENVLRMSQKRELVRIVNLM